MTRPARSPAVVNAHATRLALLIGGAAAQFAIMPLLSGVSAAFALGSYLAVGLATLRLPLPKVAPGGRSGGFRLTMAPRQATALAVMMVGAVMVLARVNTFDPNSKAAALTTLLLVVQVAHCLALQTRREAALGCAIIIVMLSVGAAFAGDVTLLLPVMVALPAVAVTASLLHRGALIDGADVTSAGGVGSIVRACVTPVVLATVLGLVVFLVLPDTGHLRTHARLASTAGNSDPSSGPASGGSSGRAASDPGAGTIDLGLRGSLSNAAVFEAPANSPAYWQGAIFSNFDGQSWTAHGPFTEWTSGPGATQLAPVDPTSQADDVVSTYTVRVLMTTPLDVVLAPGHPTSYLGVGRVIDDTDGTPHVTYDSATFGAATYIVSSTLPKDAANPDSVASTGSDLTNPQWLEIPADLPGRVSALAASLVAGSTSRLNAVNSVEDYLRTTEKYNLNSPLPKPGDDAVDDFLFVSHQGFCEQFATAAVVMLRSQGIPARFVTGYAVGDSTIDPGERVFRGSDAHAWVQVFYPGVGWVNSDPTASAVLQTSVPSLRQRIGASMTRLWHRVPGGRWGAVVALALAVVIGAALSTIGRRWLRRRRRYIGIDRGRHGDGPILAAYLRLDIALHGVERARAPSESLGELAGRLGGFVATPGEVAAAISYLERETYSVDPPSGAESAAAIAVFDRLRLGAGSQLVAVAVGTGTGTNSAR
ncbi:MAG TPA: transglutaminaseTgpA domain-containing protein [Acidothermaceae bacterium]